MALTPEAEHSLFRFVPSVPAHISGNRTVAEVCASTAGLFIYLVPVFGVLLSLIFLRESLYLFHLAGMTRMAGSVYFATTRKA